MQMNLPFIKCTEVDWALNNGSHFQFTVARLDEIHPFVSGNKFFKLKYNVARAKREGRQGIITMGGAFSNHLAATAYSCNTEGLQSAAIIRGEIVKPLNTTLSFCEQQQMKLMTVDRKDYRKNSATVEHILSHHPHFLFVPEGGDNDDGLQGCKEILSMITNADSYSHIICSMGTGTTFKGIAASAKAHQTVIGIPVLKIKAEEKDLFLENHAAIESAAQKFVLFDHAGEGYAKLNTEQINFMNLFYIKTSIPTDIIYTGKLMLALTTLAEQNYFHCTNKIIVLHTGGLQGNKSLQAGTLVY